MSLGKGLATAAAWLSVAIIVCAMTCCTYSQDRNRNAYKLACFQAGGHEDWFSTTCVK